MRKRLPRFISEAEEAEFWETHSAADYIDESTEIDVDVSAARAARQREVQTVLVLVPKRVLSKANQRAEKLGISLDRLLLRCLDRAVYGPRSHRRKHTRKLHP